MVYELYLIKTITKKEKVCVRSVRGLLATQRTVRNSSGERGQSWRYKFMSHQHVDGICFVIYCRVLKTPQNLLA